MSPVRNLLAIDPSLTCSGWALFSVNAGKLLAVGKIRSLPPRVAMAQRMSDLQDKIDVLLTKLSCGQGDVMITEAPTTMRDPRAAIVVEQVRGMFETLARGREVMVPGRLNPRSVHHELLGMKGKQLPRVQIKDMAVHAVHRLFAESLMTLGFDPSVTHLRKHQDIVDALLVGCLSMARVRTAVQAGSADLSEMFISRASGMRAARR